jgi:hypothetical protein
MPADSSPTRLDAELEQFGVDARFQDTTQMGLTEPEDMVGALEADGFHFRPGCSVRPLGGGRADGLNGSMAAVPTVPPVAAAVMAACEAMTVSMAVSVVMMSR